MNVRSVGKPSFIAQPFEDTWECTLERSPINVKIVGKPLVDPVHLEAMKEFTLERNFLNVSIVAKPSIGPHPYINMWWECTLDRQIITQKYREIVSLSKYSHVKTQLERSAINVSNTGKSDANQFTCSIPENSHEINVLKS